MLYENLQMRTTEKIIKTAKVTILKYTPCVVVGWELHPGDRKRVDDGERFLEYLPRVIYVKFEKAEWCVDANLGQGVFPLYPVKRTWLLNSEAGVKVERTGFTVLPDFASTAFMMQGTSLEAALADCGDALSLGELKDMMIAYVILSRVKKASGLLLLRPFSPYLFQQGESPGPYCLLKLLRARFSARSNVSAGEDRVDDETTPIYGPDDAIKEYKELTARRGAERTKRSHEGVRWECFDCGKAYPPEGYGADSKKQEDVYSKCVAPGHWRHCCTCRKVCEDARDAGQDASSLPTRSCQRCEKSRPVCYFDGEAAVCLSCREHKRFQKYFCQECHKSTPAGALTDDTAMTEDDFVCKECGPEKHALECSFCHTRKTLKHFREDQRTKNDKREIVRCNGCARCIVCGLNHISDFSGFSPGQRYCPGCKALACDVCAKLLSVNKFSTSQLHNKKDQNTLLRCQSCHTCVDCKDEKSAEEFKGVSKECRT